MLQKILQFCIILILCNEVFFSQCGGSPGASEFYIYITDSPGGEYRIKAEKEGNFPIYDENFNFTENYNFQWERKDAQSNPLTFYAGPNSYTTNIGFDWVAVINHGQGCRGTLGYGKYKITIQRKNSENNFNDVFYFYIDELTTAEYYFYDLQFYLQYSDEIISASVKKSGGDLHELTLGDTVVLWQFIGMPGREISHFIKSPLISNDFSGVIRNDVPITLLESVYGFPLESYTLNHNYFPGENPNFWKGAKYKFGGVSEVLNNSQLFKIRSWNSLPIYGKVAEISINTNFIKPFYNHALPLTVINNLEGSNLNNNYKIKWNANGEEQTINPNDPPYNAFDFSITEDEYNITAFSSFQLAGTSWYFQNRATGETTTLLPNEQITATNNNFTAIYKGSQRSDDADAFDNSSQRKFIKTNDENDQFIAS